MGDFRNGERPEDDSHLLQVAQVQEAGGLRWPDQACLPQEGEDHQEDYPQADLQRVQGRSPEADQAREALRDLRQEAQDQGPDVLSITLIVQSLVNLLQS